MVVLVADHCFELLDLMVHVVKSAVEIVNFFICVLPQVVNRCILSCTEISEERLKIFDLC